MSVSLKGTKKQKVNGVVEPLTKGENTSQDLSGYDLPERRLITITRRIKKMANKISLAQPDGDIEGSFLLFGFHCRVR
jgi:hypothetical protein